MVGAQRLESVTYRVEDPEATVEFCTEIMGLVELDLDGDGRYLGCGLDPKHDIVVKEGDTSLESMTFRVTDEEFDEHVGSLEEHGVDTERRTEPGHERGVYFELPHSGITTGLVVVEDKRYHHSAGATHFLDSTAPISTQRSEIAPLDLDHIGIISPDIEADSRWLVDVLDFFISDAKTTDGEWDNGFLRYGTHHHDISVFALDPENTHHHLAWAMSDMSQMKLFADRLAQNGDQLELAFTKHGPGANISIYFREPNGIRFEYATEVSTLDADTPQGIYEGSRRAPEEGISLWGGLERPESFREGV